MERICLRMWLLCYIYHFDLCKLHYVFSLVFRYWMSQSKQKWLWMDIPDNELILHIHNILNSNRSRHSKYTAFFPSEQKHSYSTESWHKILNFKKLMTYFSTILDFQSMIIWKHKGTCFGLISFDYPVVSLFDDRHLSGKHVCIII